MSMTFKGLTAILVNFILNKVGVPLADEQLNEVVGHVVDVVTTLGTLGSIIWAAYGRYRRGDVTVTGQYK